MSARPLASLVGYAETAEAIGRMIRRRHALARLLDEFRVEADELAKLPPGEVDPDSRRRLARRIATLRRWDAELAIDLADFVAFDFPPGPP